MNFEGLKEKTTGKIEKYDKLMTMYKDPSLHYALNLAKNLNSDLLKDLENIEYNRKVKIPQFVAEYITIALRNNRSSGEIMCSFATSSVGKEIDAWFYDKNINTLFDALVYGYEVEEEPKYRVVIPNPNSTARHLCTGLKKSEGDGKVILVRSRIDTFHESEFGKLTEAEIKKEFDWAFQFAKPVEEVNHG